MYIFDLQDILFAIKSIKLQTNQFNINDYITFNSTNTRSGASNKLLLPQHLNYHNILTFIVYHPHANSRLKHVSLFVEI